MGRHTSNNLSEVPKGQLKKVRNLLKNVNVKAGLIEFRKVKNSSAKAWINDMQFCLNG